MQISDIFYHHKKAWILWITSFGKYFYRKPEEILSFLMILDENPNVSPKIRQKVAYSRNFIWNKKKIDSLRRKWNSFIYCLPDSILVKSEFWNLIRLVDISFSVYWGKVEFRWLVIVCYPWCANPPALLRWGRFEEHWELIVPPQ